MRVLVALAFLCSLLAGCASEPPPQVCSELAAANDIGGIAQAIDNVAPGHDYAANELQATGVVNESCPDQEFKLARYREQVLNPVLGGG